MPSKVTASEKRQAKEVIASARSLMASGLLGKDLWGSLTETYPNLRKNVATKVKAAIRKEIGILGQAAHDPNMFKNCREATDAKKRTAAPELMVLTYRTPVCGSCSFNKAGSCGLMGGKLIASPEDISEESVRKTASLMMAENADHAQEIKNLVKAEASPKRRVAGLHLMKLKPREDSTATDAADVQRSRTVASIMDQKGMEITIQPAKRHATPKIRNADQREQDQTNLLPGDRVASRRVAKLGNLFHQETLNITENEKTGRRVAAQKVLGDLQISERKNGRGLTANATFDVPMERAPKSKVIAEHQDQADEVYHKIVTRTASLLSKGNLTEAQAGQIKDRLDTLSQHGARRSRVGRKIERILSVMTGGIE